MYKIIGADQKEYGPISADQIRQWISEGRLNGQTMACLDGTQDWKPLSAFPEFGFTHVPTTAPIPGAPGLAPVPLEEIKARDYSLDLMSCFSRAWTLLKENFGTVFVTFLLFIGLTFGTGFLIQMVFAATGISHLPPVQQTYFRPIAAIFSSLVVGPALGGLFHVYLSLLRGEPATAGELMEGFKSFQDFFLIKLISAIITAAFFFPYTYVVTVKIAPYLEKLQQHQPTSTTQDPIEMLRGLFSTMASSYIEAWPYLLAALIPATYLAVNWQFAVPLVADRKVGFWSAMTTSWKIVHKHWFHIFGLVVLASLLNVAGGLLCCIGLLVSVPLGTLAVCYAYEDIFGRKAA